MGSVGDVRDKTQFFSPQGTQSLNAKIRHTGVLLGLHADYLKEAGKLSRTVKSGKAKVC